MPTITISGTPIDFPDDGSSPDWAPAIVAFAEAVESALSGVSGPFDVSPQVLNIDTSNPGSGTLTGLSFSPSQVRSVNVRYSVYRTTSLVDTAYEQGMLYAVYNPDNASNQKWEVSREYTGAGASISFSMSDAGVISYTTTSLSGTSHFGRISYAAIALTQT